jgi:hypothetical protein
MADFDPPFGSVGGNTRLPTVDERQEGFGCGPADQALFNGMFGRLEAEMQSVFDEAGIAGDDGDNTILVQSILALIAAATGGSGDYVLMSQARSRLEIFPSVQHADGHLNITSPGTGQIRIPASRTFLHRGIFPVTTSLTDIATSASKTYHLRWNPTDGFELQDLADIAYNPSSVVETSAIFDSTYDDMLVARVVTNASNVPTITNLLNKTRLSSQTDFRTALAGALDWTTLPGSNVTLNWARTPIIYQANLTELRSNNSGPGIGVTPIGQGIFRAFGERFTTKTRYGNGALEYYYEDDKAGTAADQGLFALNITALAV